MCLSCGCVLSGGSPTDDHDDDRNITIGDIQAAADALGLDTSAIADNIAASLATLADDAVVIDEGDDVAVVEKRLSVGPDPKRFVLGVAYPAEKMDGHGEFMTAAEVEAQAWDYARNHRQIGFFHADGTLGHADVVESYIYRGPDWRLQDITGADQVVKSGDWMLGAVLDDPGFAAVLEEKVDGWSIQGMMKRRLSPAPKERQ